MHNLGKIFYLLVGSCCFCVCKNYQTLFTILWLIENKQNKRLELSQRCLHLWENPTNTGPGDLTVFVMLLCSELNGIAKSITISSFEDTFSILGFIFKVVYILLYITSSCISLLLVPIAEFV